MHVAEVSEIHLQGLQGLKAGEAGVDPAEPILEAVDHQGCFLSWFIDFVVIV
jgi:hypothetical protein